MLTEKYNHKEKEKTWQKYWHDKKIFAWKNDLIREKTFVIDTPPPTVSGLLHMGHVFSYTQADFIARYQRMLGKDVFYPIGFDDNGLPTERLVEKILGKKAAFYEKENGEGSFVSKCREIVDESEKEFENLFNSIALSVDWDQKYQTISKETQKISQASFIDLYKKGFVERKFEPVFWDCSDRTALAQADLVDKEMDGEMNFILFGVEGSAQKIEIMTTRPELLPACVAVMINPEDSKYQHLKDKFAITPIFGVKVPIIFDEDVKIDKGTGIVMCCTFGDETDIKWWRKYNLELRTIIGQDGKMLDFSSLNNDKENYIDLENFKFHYENLVSGKKIKEAKDLIIKELRDPSPNRQQAGSSTLPQGEGNPNFASQANNPNFASQANNPNFASQANAGPQSDVFLNRATQENITPLLTKQEKIKHVVKCAERSGAPIEILVMPQWFIKILDKKDELKKQAQKCNWNPEYMQVRIEQWIDGLSWDWCISRQRFFGVPFPAWYSKRAGEEGKILVADIDQLPCDPRTSAPKGYSPNEVEPESDIMDTWATSSISPQLSSKGISSEICFDEQRHKKLFPADLRPQAHEIIRTWAFYTIVKSYLHEKEIPWKNLMISGWCLAADKTKMSKSKGNVVTPTSLIEEKGSDIVRYWASTSQLGADTAYSEEVFKIGQKLLTKLYNAAKFAVLMMGEKKYDDNFKNVTEACDLWILSRLSQTIKNAEEQFEKFEYAKAREKIEDFFWNDFCDNYLEIVKVRAYGLNAEKLAGADLSADEKAKIQIAQQSAIITLKNCLNVILKLFAPFIPHICEELYANIFKEEFEKNLSINARSNWPQWQNYPINQNSLMIGEAILKIIFEVRKFKSDNNLSMKTTISCLKIENTIDLTAALNDLSNVCNATKIEFAKSAENKIEIVL